MIYAVAIVASLAIGYIVGRRAGVRSGRFDMLFDKQRADGLFQACDAELNTLKVKLSTALMQLEDARKK